MRITNKPIDLVRISKNDMQPIVTLALFVLAPVVRCLRTARMASDN